MKKQYNDQYFEGVLQLRNPNKEIFRFVKKKIEEAGEFISKEVKQKNGFDCYISSQKFLRRLGKKLQQSFKGELKVNYRLFSRDKQTSKEIHRINVFFRAIDHKKDDVIDFKGDKLKIIGIGKDVLCRNVETGEKIHLDFSKIS